RRLEGLGLAAATQRATGKRKRVEYRVTAAGGRALRAWVGPPLAEEAVTVTHDPLRSRARFLGVLTEDQRRRWVEAALAALDEVERRGRAWDGEFGGLGGPGLLTRNGVLEVKMRRTWLEEIRERT